MVSRSPKHVSGNSQETSSIDKTSKTTSQGGLPSISRVSQFSRLETISQAAKSEGFSDKVANRLFISKRPGTTNLYNCRWKAWHEWCTSKHWDPFDPSVPHVTEFLVYLFETKEMAFSTLKGYSSTICTTLKATCGVDISLNLTLREVLKSFFLERPFSNNTTPKWNLAKVLNSLIKEPYEPLSNASLKHLTWKTTFLLSLASGKRCGELHALTDTVGHSTNWSRIILRPSPGFLAKTHSKPS